MKLYTRLTDLEPYHLGPSCTPQDTDLSCKWTDSSELCASDRCLQVNREAWVCWEGHEQGSDANGATTCNKCRPGHYRSDFDGAATCTVCETGQFMPFEGGTACSTCPTGQYTGSCNGQSDAGCACTDSDQPGCTSNTGTCPHEGCVRCKNCPLGYYGGTLNDEGCDNGGVGPTNCMNTVGRQNAATSCDACGVGFYGGGGVTPCSQCGPGQYTDSGAQTVCKNCPNGQFQDDLQSTGCKACPIGHKGKGAGENACPPCAPGEHSVDPGIAGYG